MRNPITESRAVTVVVAAIVGALAAGALAMASVSAANEALDDASSLRSIDLVSASHDTATVTLSRAVLVSEDAAAGVGSDEDLALAVDAAASAIAKTAADFDSLLESDREELVDTFAAWSQDAGSVAALASGGQPDQAAEAFNADVAESSAVLTAALLDKRDARAASVNDTEGAIGLFIRVAGFALLFLLPLAAILVYRVSARRQLETAVAQMDVRLDAERLSTSSRERFFAGFADELRGRVAAVTQEAGRFGVKAVAAKSEDLADRVEDLAVAVGNEPPALNPTVVSMNDQLDWIIARFSSCGAAVGGTYGSGLAYADESRVRQILRNLVDNAVARGGSTIRIYGDVAGSYYVVSVEDDGSGLPGEVTEAIAAGTVDPADGLDLAVATRLAGALGGMLEHEELAGRTALVLSVPIAAPAASDEMDELVAADH